MCARKVSASACVLSALFNRGYVYKNNLRKMKKKKYANMSSDDASSFSINASLVYSQRPHDGECSH
jgi:hypothetical protein